MKYVAWLWQNTQGTRLNSSVRIVLGAAQVALGLLMVWLSKRFIDETIHTGSREAIVQMIILLALTVLGRILLRQVYFYMTTVASTRKANELRLSLFAKLFSRRLFDEKELHSGDVTSRLSKDIDSVSGVIAETIPQMVVTGLQLLGAFLLMRFFDAWLAWALVIFTPLAIVLGKFVARKLRRMTLDIREKESQIQMHVQEGVEYNAVLRSLGSEQWMADRLDSMQQELKGNVLRRTKFSTITRFMLGIAFGFGYLAAFVWGGLGLYHGTITFGVMTSFLQLVGQIQQPILSLLNMTPQVIHSTASIDRLEELQINEFAEDEASDALHTSTALNSEEPASSSAGAFHTSEALNGTASNGAAGVKFEDVSFRYAKGDSEIITHFSHDFKPGTKTALVGETGVGKTTLFRLMLGFITPTGGNVALYSRTSSDLQKTSSSPGKTFCDPQQTSSDPQKASSDPQQASNVMQTVSKSTRKHFVYVPQGNTLMSGSIRYNLLLAKPGATEQELQSVLHTACADFVSELPDGLDSELGERGCGLSEGQAQRIAIARGLLREGSVLLLDEISASLDEETERELYRRLFAAYPTKTMIFITHRSAICELCDETLKV